MSDSGSGKVILLADDDSDDRELFCEAISQTDTNITVHQVENGNEALKKLKELPTKPDMIFLDINMPIMTGWECLKVLREVEEYKKIPVIIYSSSSNHREKQIAMDLGASLFFTKPDDFYLFREKLQGIINDDLRA